MRGVTRSLVVVALLSLASLVAGCGEEDPRGVRERAPRAVSVRAAPVERGGLALRERFTGELWAEAADLAPRITGRVVEVRARLGDRVEKGAVLARLDDGEVAPQLAEAKAAITAAEASEQRAKASLAAARAELDRKRPLAEDKLVSAQELAEIEARVLSLEADAAASAAQAAQARARVNIAEEQLRNTRVVAPFAGVVAARHLDPGATATPSTPILRIVADGPPRLRARAPESALAVLRPGLALNVSTAATGARAFPGTLERIGGEVSRTDRTVQIEGVLREESPLLLPGMYATIEVRVQDLEGVLRVPAIAILERQIDGKDARGVFVDDGGRAAWRPVTVLGRAGDVVAVDGGLKEGERVLTLGHEELSPGGPIRVVETRSPSPPPPPEGNGT